VIRSVLGIAGENVGDEDLKSDHPLVATSDGTTDPFGCALGLVQWDQSGDQTEPEATKDTTDDDSSCCDPENDADGEDKT
jgi:hypothetical protein